jgi:glycerate kinase
VTGEGRLDASSTAGKAISAVAGACAAAGVPCVALCGQVALGPGAIRRMGLTAALAVGREPRRLPDALAALEGDLAAAGAALGALWQAAEEAA